MRARVRHRRVAAVARRVRARRSFLERRRRGEYCCLLHVKSLKPPLTGDNVARITNACLRCNRHFAAAAVSRNVAARLYDANGM